MVQWSVVQGCCKTTKGVKAAPVWGRRRREYQSCAACWMAMAVSSMVRPAASTVRSATAA